MKKFILICAICGLIAGCGVSTQLTYVYKPAEYNPLVYKKLAVIAIVPKNQARVQIENYVVDQLRARGIKAMTTWSIFQFANNPEVLKQAGFVGEKKREIVRQKVSENNIDALLTITLFDANREKRYVPGTSSSVGVGVSGPVYGYGYSAYCGYAWDVTSTPGYYEDASTYMLESNLYDISSEKLLWSGQTRTDMKYSLEQEAYDFSKVLVNGIIDGSKQKKK
jgi:hypothetical protein